MTVAVALVMSAAGFAGNKVKDENSTLMMNVNGLSRYLGLSSNQYAEVQTISEYFNEQMRLASFTKQPRQAKRYREVLYGNMKLMKGTLTNEQYRKYLRLMNLTVKRRGLDIYMK